MDNLVKNEFNEKGKIPKFIKKLYHLTNNSKFKEIIGWSKKDDKFFIHDVDEFTLKLLPQYFHKLKFSSFIRQLNIYNFKKIKNCDGKICYKNRFFKKGVKSILNQIKRKKHKKLDSNQDDESSSENFSNSNIPNDNRSRSEYLNELKNKADSLYSSFNQVTMAIENVSNYLEVVKKSVKSIEENQSNINIILNSLGLICRTYFSNKFEGNSQILMR